MAGVEQGNFNMSALNTVKISKTKTKRLTDGKNREEILFIGGRDVGQIPQHKSFVW